MTLLTKSKFLNGLQCHRLLWFADKKKLPEVSLFDKHKFAQGHEFEKYVKPLFSSGVDLGGLEFSENIEKTLELIAQNKTVFEAGIQVDNFFCKVDVLEFVNGGWNLCEIKASNSVKPKHIPDIAFQKFVCEKAGLNIKSCYVYYLNKEFVKDGDIDPEQLVLKEDVFDKVNQIVDVQANAKDFLKIFEEQNAPDVPIGKHCNKPYDCSLKPDCWSYLPEYNVFQLINWRVYWKLFEGGILDIKDIPNGTKLNDKELIIKDAVVNNETFITKSQLKSFLDSLNYPLYHLDFETFDTAVPIFEKSKPWQKIPFQYSIHVQHEDSKTDHNEFLADGDSDPRPLLLESMKKIIGTTGDVIVFNKTFEEGRLKEFAEDFPEHKDWIQNVLDRIIDLLVPFKNFLYYNPIQKGSLSIKSVLPAITRKGYDELEINNAEDASMFYFYSHIKEELPNKEDIRKNLLKYCGLDSEGMVWIINKFKELVD